MIQILNRISKQRKRIVEPDLYKTLADIPFVKFERCFIHRDYKQLLRNDPTVEPQQLEKLLQQAWFELYSEYCEAVGDRTAIKIARLNYQILYLAAKIDKCSLMISVLKNTRSSVMEEVLASELSGVQFADFEKGLSRAESKLKTHILRLNELIAERDNAVPTGHKELTEQYFTEILIECSTIEGYKISKKDIMAGEFCSYFRRLKDHIERNTTLKRHN